jgi:hypothetical protein
LLNINKKEENKTIVRTVVMPSETLAGDDVLSSQNDTVDRITIRVDGKYI